MRAEWLAYSAWEGRNVQLQMGNNSVQGQVLGVGDKGEICLLVDGEERKYLGGEISLRLQHDS